MRFLAPITRLLFGFFLVPVLPACGDDGSGGSGGSGGGAVTCTAESAPEPGCEFEVALGTVCEVELEGGCPNTTVTWSCEGGEGGPSWLRRSDSHCDCADDGVDEAACSGLPGCAWAVPDELTCPAELFGDIIPVEGCYRTDCGYAGWGNAGGECRSDLCAGP